MRKLLVNIQYGMILLIMLATIFPNAAAFAAAVTNLDDKDQVIEVRYTGGYESVTIKPGETWRTGNAVTVKFGSTENWIDTNEEFAIWKGGEFGPQKENNKNNKGNL